MLPIKAAPLTVDNEIIKELPTAGYVERPESFYDVIRRTIHTSRLVSRTLQNHY
jgi:hypothetical protein